MKELQRFNQSDFDSSIEKYIPLENSPNMFDFSDIGDGSEYTANIGWSDQDFSHTYTESFYKSAELLVNEGRGSIDYLVYPIVFLYRHYTELALKDLILLCCIYFGEGITFKKNHNIESLLVEFSTIIDKYQIGYMLPHEIRLAIKQISDIDEKNDKFRYTHDYRGEPSHDHSNKFLNLHDFQLGMRQIHEYLDLISLWFDEQSESKLTDSYFVSFINSLSNLKNRNNLTRGGELGNKVYLFSKYERAELDDRPLNPLDQSIDTEQKFYVVRNSIVTNNQDDTVECTINYADETTDEQFAKIVFKLNAENNKVLNFKVLE